MKYRDAKRLKQGDVVVSKQSGTTYHVKNIEVYGNVKMVRVNVVTECGGGDTSFLHDELK